MNSNHTPLWTSDAAMQATGGITPSTWQVSGVSIDSRTLEPGDLFVAIAGPVHDGHQFLASAFSAGASAALVQASHLRQTDRARFADKLLIVDDSLQALGRLTQAARQRTAAKVIAVTGSVGKTGTKEMLRLVLSEQGETTATAGNLNNHYGLPLSLARLPQQAAYGVFELGMSAAGEILPLTRMTRPHVALITTIESAHSEFFKSIEDISDAKAEIFAGLEPAGIAILNGDNPMFERLSQRATEAGVGDIRVFGAAVRADCRLLDVQAISGGSRVNVDLRGKQISFEISVPGRHWVQNALGVLCAVEALGADPEIAAARLAGMAGIEGRGRHHILSISGGSAVLIDESYNASPASMKAALEVLGEMAVPDQGRKIAVLGDMLELGAGADSLHAGLADVLIDKGIDLVFTTGQHMAALR
ncbi:MAG: UDP-N-acetylmuramoyl-tripeptide--D-alanyl-D-alanine ligase, partial [Rhodospirillales bacterium]|nr:UDP-N-acetylmuramoyl-tripeptide--D-alanyl-D-alanine ligase [Rhodospirillales bacterium]